MSFLYLLSIVAIIVQVVSVTFAIAAGMYYLAELVEEHTVTAKYVISWIVIITIAFQIGLIIFDDLPLHLNMLGLLQQGCHALLLRHFPAVRVASPTFIVGVANLVLTHYLAFQYFATVYYKFSECCHALLLRRFPAVRVASPTFIVGVANLVLTHYLAFQYFATVYYKFSVVLAYFTLFLWLVPFTLFVSLSANDYVLPTTGEKQPLLGDNNVVTDYLSRKAKRYSLLSFFSYAKESILPQRNKKAF